MSKISVLRERVAALHEKNDLEAAANAGELLLCEHQHNENNTMSYASDLFSVARIYDDMGDLECAVDLYSEATKQFAAVDGERLPFAVGISNMAIALSRLGVRESAYCMLGQAVGIYKREVGENDLLYADALYNFANAAADMGQKKDALDWHATALKIRMPTKQSNDKIDSLHSLAFLHESDNAYENAAIYAEMAQRISFYCGIRPLAGSTNYLAGLQEATGELDKALALYDLLIRIATDHVGREHSAYLNVAFRRANLLAQMKRHREALDSQAEVCEIFERIAGTQHLFYANCLRQIASLHCDLGEHHAAETPLLDSMKIRRVLLQDISLDALFLVRLYLRDAQPQKAFDTLVYALMCAGEKPESSPLVDVLAEIFADSTDAATAEFIKTMEDINDPEALGPIIDKWTRWEAN